MFTKGGGGEGDRDSRAFLSNPSFSRLELGERAPDRVLAFRLIIRELLLLFLPSNMLLCRLSLACGVAKLLVSLLRMWFLFPRPSIGVKPRLGGLMSP